MREVPGSIPGAARCLWFGLNQSLLYVSVILFWIVSMNEVVGMRLVEVLMNDVANVRIVDLCNRDCCLL